MFSVTNKSARPPKKKYIKLRSKEDVLKWCKELNCTEIELRKAMGRVGASVVALEAYLWMNKQDV